MVSGAISCSSLMIFLVKFIFLSDCVASGAVLLAPAVTVGETKGAMDSTSVFSKVQNGRQSAIIHFHMGDIW